MKIQKHFALIIFLFSILIFSCTNPQPDVQIVETTYNNTPHFKITTPNATYYYEKKSGGFSGILDRNGTDWVQFRISDSVSVPKSADSDFRGLPNMVHGGEQSGIGHPGFDQCVSKLINDSVIRTTSRNGNYAWTWTFFPHKAQMDIFKVDKTRNYWFLYEGPIAGKYNPATHYIITNEGRLQGKPAIMKGGYFKGRWDWVAFGDKKTDLLFYTYHLTGDTLTDIATYMGNSSEGLTSPDGMVVFGFGRDKHTKSLMSEVPNSFEIGFVSINKSSNDTLSLLKNLIEKP